MVSNRRFQVLVRRPVSCKPNSQWLFDTFWWSHRLWRPSENGKKLQVSQVFRLAGSWLLVLSEMLDFTCRRRGRLLLPWILHWPAGDVGWYGELYLWFASGCRWSLWRFWYGKNTYNYSRNFLRFETSFWIKLKVKPRPQIHTMDPHWK